MTIGMICDTQSLRVTCDNIGVKTRGQEGPVAIHYELGIDKFEDDNEEGGGKAEDHDAIMHEAFFNKEGIMCSFRMRTLDAV